MFTQKVYEIFLFLLGKLVNPRLFSFPPFLPLGEDINYVLAGIQYTSVYVEGGNVSTSLPRVQSCAGVHCCAVLSL